MPTYTAATNPAYLDGLAQGWTVQGTVSEGGGDQSLVDGGSAPLSGIAGGGSGRNGLTAWAFDSLFTTTGPGSIATGTQFASRFFWPGGNINNLWVHCTAAPSTQTHGWLAAFDGSGAKWAASADLGATALTTSPAANSVPMASAPVSMPSGWYWGYGAFVYSAGSLILDKFSPTVTGTAMNDNMATSNWQFATNSTTVSALPASLAWGTGWAADTTDMVWFGAN